ncbi:uncharacterized protein LOC114313942 [Camellia sinensis]|uniref:Mediator of RNA polymerase II transcription subunit 1 n=1 Tax=Camellia sinensis var. sinensis TaxID=542762 RepID=A0A4S4D886_CAMSN|nr:uncharacterized protein LOC114313942 [Camellia sinensis]XP_028116172.1 uncharacterized protein LOC114313942 [Camellia sinensis]THF98662.1 hypothetical protein TEA_026751 [Camellia sinensis var. sinensis]
MERSEPTLVPEWLRNTGSVSGGGNSAHHFASSSHSDVLSSARATRNRSSRSISDKDNPHSAFLDRISSSNSRCSSNSNGSSKHPYSSFSRSNRDKNRDKEKDRSGIGDIWDHSCFDPLEDILISRAEKDTLRRSRSLVCRKPCEVLPRRAVDLRNGGSVDLRIGGSNNYNSSNGVLSGGSLVSSIQKIAFEKDFPSLGTEEKEGVPDIGRVSSPGLSTAVQSLPVGNTGLIGGEGWTSALAEVPTIIGSNSMGSSSVQQSVLAIPPGASSPMTGLNMAEALSQAPPRAHTTPQLPDKTQRLEELAKKQSRQLIPVTPSMPKGLVLSSDKSKPKTAARTGEAIVAVKSVQQQQPHSSQVANQSRSGQVRSDASRPSHAGKFFILKPVWENGVSSMAKDVSSLTTIASRVANSQLATAPVGPSTPLKSPNNSKLSTVEHKVAALALNSGSTVEKRPSLSQAQSRSDFFNLMRKKTSPNTSAFLPDSGVAVISPTVEKSGEVVKGASALVSPCVTEDGSKVASNGDTHEGEKNLCLNGAVYPDEEEAAFLRSLGWEENAGEDDGLTEEEINAFYEEYVKLRPTMKLCIGMQPKLSTLCESHVIGSGRASSELTASECETEA